jgi:Recombination endonuclease VII
LRVPVTIYADFESYIKPISTCEPCSDKSCTKKYQQHEANSFCIYAKPSDDVIEARRDIGARGANGVSKPISYTDTAGVNVNVGELCIKSLGELAVSINSKYEAEKYYMIFTKADELTHVNSTHCHICELPLTKGIHASEADDNDITVRDHCHITGKYRGAAHKSCNLNYKLPKFYPVIMHNLSGYDVHLFIKHLKVILKLFHRLMRSI